MDKDNFSIYKLIDIMCIFIIFNHLDEFISFITTTIRLHTLVYYSTDIDMIFIYKRFVYF